MSNIKCTNKIVDTHCIALLMKNAVASDYPAYINMLNSYPINILQ